jgi:hypothetical protein
LISFALKYWPRELLASAIELAGLFNLREKKMIRICLFNVLLCVAVLSGCAQLQTRVQPENNFRLNALTEIEEPPSKNQPTNTSPDAVARLVWYRAQAIQCSDRELKQPGDDIDKCRGPIRIYLESAITASNQACNVWFDALIHSDVETTNSKNLLNIAGNSAQALMGLTGDNPTQIAKVALALGLGNAAFDNYRAVFLMSPTLHKIRKQIDEARSSATDRMRANLDLYKSWDDADEEAQKYHKSCSREAIQEILNAGLAVTSYKSVELDTDEIAYNEANQQIYQLMFGAKGQFSEAEMSALTEKKDVIFKLTPTSENLLIKAAQEKFNAVDQKGKTDFKRWLETAKNYLDAKAANAKAKKVRLETAAADDADRSKKANEVLQSAMLGLEVASNKPVSAVAVDDQTTNRIRNEKLLELETAKKNAERAAKRAEVSRKLLAETTLDSTSYGTPQNTKIKFEAVIDLRKLNK